MFPEGIQEGGMPDPGYIDGPDVTVGLGMRLFSFTLFVVLYSWGVGKH